METAESTSTNEAPAPAPRPSRFQFHITDIFVLAGVTLLMHKLAQDSFWHWEEDDGSIFSGYFLVMAGLPLASFLVSVFLLKNSKRTGLKRIFVLFGIMLLMLIIMLPAASFIFSFGPQSRMARNESAVYSDTKKFVTAEYAYFSKSVNGIQEYAPTLEQLGTAKLISPAFAQAEYGNPKNPNPIPYHGYFFKVLTAQGDSAPGGAKSYYVNGRMTLSFALQAFPARPNISGINMFVVDHTSTTYTSLKNDLKIMDVYEPQGYGCVE